MSEGDEEQQGPTPLDQAFRALESSVGGVEASLTSVGDRTSRLEEEVAGKANSSEVDRIEGTVLEHQQVVEELTTDMSSLLHKAEVRGCSCARVLVALTLCGALPRPSSP